MRLSRVIVAAVAALILVGCQPATSDKKDNNNNSGSEGTSFQMMLDLPESLTPAESPNGAESEVTASLSGAVAEAPAEDVPESVGYYQLYNAIDMVRGFSGSMSQFGVMTDAVVAQNSLTPSADTRSGYSITVTQTLLDRITAAVPEGMQDSESSAPELGSSFPMPDFVYNTVDNIDGFDYSFAFTQDMGGEEPSVPASFRKAARAVAARHISAAEAETSMSMTMTVYWNTAHTKFASVMDMSGNKMTFAFDQETKSAMMKIEATGLVYKLNFLEDETSETGGVFARIAYSLTIDGLGTFDSTGVAYGDTEGGAIEYSSVAFGGNAGYREGFDSAGALTYQATEDPEAETPEWTATYEGDGEPTAYLGKLEIEDWGAADDFEVPSVEVTASLR